MNESSTSACPNTRTDRRQGDAGRRTRTAGYHHHHHHGGRRSNHQQQYRNRSNNRPRNNHHRPRNNLQEEQIPSCSQTKGELIKLCSVCSQGEKKYKCPRCESPYCSVACFRIHKNECQAEGTEAKAKEESRDTLKSESKDNRYGVDLQTERVPLASIAARDEHAYDDLEEGWKMNQEIMIPKLLGSSWLRNELKDSGLRVLISKIATASNIVGHQQQTQQEEILEFLKEKYPVFQSFVDRLLVLTEVLERQGDDANVSLEEWLKHANVDSSTLHLRTLPRKRRKTTLETRIENMSSSSESSDESCSGIDDTSTDS